MPEKVTDADLMTGFNPNPAVSAEDFEARQAGDVPYDDQPEGERADTEAAAPEERTITLDGRTYRAPKDIADAFTREINRRDGTHGAELQRVRERLTRLETARTSAAGGEKPETKPELPKAPDPDLAIENPAEHQRQLIAHLEAKEDARREELRVEYEQAEAAKAQETARKAAWQTHCDRFYALPENTILRDNRDIVDAVMAQNMDSLASLSVEDGFKELGRLAKERLSRITGQAPEIKARTPKPPVLEGSTRRQAQAGPARKQEEGPQSLSAALKERRKAAAEAFSRGGSRTAIPQSPR
jgi:hypothetical protein